jgi:hypothetical protein
MSKFNVGDRVRVIDSRELPQHEGEQTVITEVMGRAYHQHPDFPNDTWYCTELTFEDGERCVYPAGALEPIYDGNETVSWSSCVWQPNRLRVC